MKTVLITGCSSGYGLETARYFLAQGWKVIATMRTPKVELFPNDENLLVLALDVTDPESIANAVESAGPIDVLVNNAGIGLFGAFEATPISSVREIFETNTFGTMAMCQAVVPQFRERRAGPSSMSPQAPRSPPSLWSPPTRPAKRLSKASQPLWSTN